MRKVNSNDLLFSYKMWPEPDGELLNFGLHWRTQAEELYVASNVLWKQIEEDWNELNRRLATKTQGQGKKIVFISDTYILMASFSIENLLKGYLLFKEPSNIKGSKLEGYNFRKHDLLSVVKDLKIDVTEHEKQFCELGTIFINWYGRYPIPKETKKKIQSMHTNLHLIRETFISFYHKLIDVMEKEGAFTRPGQK